MTLTCFLVICPLTVPQLKVVRLWRSGAFLENPVLGHLLVCTLTGEVKPLTFSNLWKVGINSCHLIGARLVLTCLATILTWSVLSYNLSDMLFFSSVGRGCSVALNEQPSQLMGQWNKQPVLTNKGQMDNKCMKKCSTLTATREIKIKPH